MTHSREASLLQWKQRELTLKTSCE